MWHTIYVPFFIDQSENSSAILWWFQNNFLNLHSEWEGPALAEEALCSKLAERKREKFSKQANSDRRAERLSRIVRGAVLLFLLLGYLTTFVPELAKAVPRFCYAYTKMNIYELKTK